jgi:chromosome segregation ATPase
MTSNPTLSAADQLVADATAVADEHATTLGQNPSPVLDETAASDELATTLTSLQNVIERNALELQRILEELKHKREQLKSVFENDTTLAEAEVQALAQVQQVKELKAKLQSHPQVTSLKVTIGELSQQKKEVEEALSNHLVNYHQITGSKSFDTSEGDQWEFDIRAKVKTRKAG